MKTILVILSLLLTQSLWAAADNASVYTDIECGEIPMADYDEDNTEDEDRKCQLLSRRMSFNGKNYKVDPDRFYKFLIEVRDGDHYAFLMWNGQVVDEDKVRREIHIELAQLGDGEYTHFEWRLKANGQRPNVYGLILGKELRPSMVIEGKRFPAKYIYETYKLNGSQSCALGLTDKLEEAQKFVDHRSCK